VFGSAERLRTLNAIIHPAVFAALERELAHLSPSQRRPYVVVEAALMFESGLHRRVDLVMTVEAPVAVRVARVVARDGSTAGAVRKRINAQLSSGERRRRADMVLRNDTDLKTLGKRVTTVDVILTALTGGGRRQGD
jgi:dephospho-CoA kinase